MPTACGCHLGSLLSFRALSLTVSSLLAQTLVLSIVLDLVVPWAAQYSFHVRLAYQTLERDIVRHGLALRM